MPRGSRLDLPGALHHVMVRGLARQVIFHDDADRTDFLSRVATVSQATGLQVLAWALLPNPAHLLVRTGQRPLATAMRTLLTGYAGAFNRRHRRVGHLFQNRYKSILVEEDPYLLELVRYIHLNPLRLNLVHDFGGLARYPWSGHPALLGLVSRPWQAVDEVLRQFSSSPGVARRRYRDFAAAGASQGRRPDLQGGGLVRSIGGWEKVLRLRRGREEWAADERILGGSEFVDEIRREMAARTRLLPRAKALVILPIVIKRCAAMWGLMPEELIGGSRRRAITQARTVVSRVAVRELGLSHTEVARHLSVSPSAVRAGVSRGEIIIVKRGLTARALLPRSRKQVS